MKEFFVMVKDRKSVGLQMAAFSKRAELLFYNKCGIKAVALTMDEFAQVLAQNKNPDALV